MPTTPRTTARTRPTERADAAHNRRKILDAARGLIDAHGIEQMSIDGVATAAGVGVGTVYRRFGDRAGLIYALIDERERQLQAAFVSGPPPLGPGAPPAERVRAFLRALLERTEEQAEMLLAAETNAPLARYASGSYRAYREHLRPLLRACLPDDDVEYLIDALLAPLAAEAYLYQRRERGIGVDRIKAGLDRLVTALLTTSSS